MVYDANQLLRSTVHQVSNALISAAQHSAAQHSTAQHSTAQHSTAQQPWFTDHDTPNHKQHIQLCKGMSQSMITLSALLTGPTELIKSPLVARQGKIALLAEACHIGKTGTNHGISHNLVTRIKVDSLPEVAQHSSTTHST